MLTAVWSANAGVMARGVNWQRFTQQQLLEICECVGGLGLAAVLRLMAEDHAGAAGEQAADKFLSVVPLLGLLSQGATRIALSCAHLSAL